MEDPAVTMGAITCAHSSANCRSPAADEGKRTAQTGVSMSCNGKSINEIITLEWLQELRQTSLFYMALTVPADAGYTRGKWEMVITAILWHPWMVAVFVPR